MSTICLSVPVYLICVLRKSPEWSDPGSIFLSPLGEDTNGRLHHHGHTWWSLWSHQEAVLRAVPSALTGAWKWSPWPWAPGRVSVSLQLSVSEALEAEIAILGWRWWSFTPKVLIKRSQPQQVALVLLLLPIPAASSWLRLDLEALLWEGKIFFIGNFKNVSLNNIILKVLVCTCTYYVHIYLVMLELELLITDMLYCMFMCLLCAYMPDDARIINKRHANFKLLNIVHSVLTISASHKLTMYTKMTLNSYSSCLYPPPPHTKVLALQVCHHGWPICGFFISWFTKHSLKPFWKKIIPLLSSSNSEGKCLCLFPKQCRIATVYIHSDYIPSYK